MNAVYEKLMRCYGSVRERIHFKPKVALVLGSGLGDYADGIQVEEVLDYSHIEGFPVSTVPGHKGRFVFGYVQDVPVVVMQGRVHYYEGYEISDVVLPIRREQYQKCRGGLSGRGFHADHRADRQFRALPADRAEHG